MFRIDAPIDASRCEPLLVPISSMTATLPRLSLSPEPLAVDFLGERRREPTAPLAATPPPGTVPSLESSRPVASNPQTRRFGPIGSLVLHLLPLLLLLDWPMHPPAEITPIPVQLVIEPPPPPVPPVRPKPAPKLHPKPEKPPPGRIASEDVGDTHAKGRERAESEASSAKKEPPTKLESALGAPLKEAAITPPPLLPNPADLSLPQPLEPRAAPAPRPMPKPAEAAHRPVQRALQRALVMPRPGRYPGPAATRNEYLAYLAALARQHIGLLSRSLIGGRRGETVVDVLVLDDGTVAMLSVGRSSGYPDIDVRVEQMIRAVGRFPPLPQWFQGSSMRLEFRLQFPEALDD